MLNEEQMSHEWPFSNEQMSNMLRWLLSTNQYIFKCLSSSFVTFSFRGGFLLISLEKKSSSQFGGTFPPPKHGEVAIGAPPVVACHPSMASIPIAMSQRHIFFEKRNTSLPCTAELGGHLKNDQFAKRPAFLAPVKGKLMKRFFFWTSHF